MSSLDTLKCDPSCRDKSPKYLFALLVLLNVVLCVVVVRYVLQSNLDSDEVEHAHVTWAMNQGIMPYRDIPQNHTPLLWIISSPIMASLPQRVETLIALRGLSLLALVGTYVAGLLVLREILGSMNRTGALALLLLTLAFYADFEFWRYRPDPLMTFCVSCAILAAVRIRRAPLWYSAISGLALGLAASFSPKMAPLCLLVPVLCLLECRCQWTLRPLLLVIPNALGFLAGVLPVVAWLCFQGLFNSFWTYTIVLNSHCVNLPHLSAASVLEHANLLLVLAVFGGGLLVVGPKSGAWKMSWPPVAGLLVAAVLAWLIRIIEPTHIAYNLQAFAMPAAVLGTVSIMKLAQWDAWPWGRRLVIVGLALVFVAGSVVGQEAWQGFSLKGPGETIPISDMRRLIDVIPSGEATCVGFAPWHPVFCRDATDLYVHFAVRALTADWVSPEAKKLLLEMWARAIAVIERGEPSLIVDRMWVEALRSNVLSQQQYDRMVRTLQSRYHCVNAGEVPVFVKNQP